MRDVFDPLGALNRLIKYWWVIVLLAIAGGFLALAISYLLPPMYQAEAVIHASVDFSEINFEDLASEGNSLVVWTQYVEDMALQVVQRALLSTQPEAFNYAQQLDPDLDRPTFLRDVKIQRYHSLWSLRYRHEDSKIAQMIVNYWANIGLDFLKETQASGIEQPFVAVDLVSEASQPQTPHYQHRNTLVLAGTVIGFFIGVLLVDFRRQFSNRQVKEA